MSARARRRWIGGRAPAAWLRAMERTGARTGGLRRAGAWVDALLADGPRLRPRADWESGLAALGLPSNPAAESASPRPSPRATDPRAAAAASRALTDTPWSAADRAPRRPSSVPSVSTNETRDRWMDSGARDVRRPSTAPPDPTASRAERRPSAADGPASSATAPRPSTAAAFPPPRAGRSPSEPFDGWDAPSRADAIPFDARQRSRRGAASPMDLPREADAALLRALASPAAVIYPARAASAPPAAVPARGPAQAWSAGPSAAEERTPRVRPAWMNPRPRAGRAASSPAPRAGAGLGVRALPLPVAEGRAAGEGWMLDTAARAARAFTGTAALSAETADALAAALPAQWDAPLAEPHVSAAWLAERAARRVESTGPDAAPGTRTAAAVDGAQTWSARRPQPASTESATMDAAAPSSVPAPASIVPAAGAPVGWAPAPAVARETEHGAAAVLPGAAAVRLPSAPMDGGAGEDLGVLARQIKRILDDEARRFGIDV